MKNLLKYVLPRIMPKHRRLPLTTEKGVYASPCSVNSLFSKECALSCQRRHASKRRIQRGASLLRKQEVNVTLHRSGRLLLFIINLLPQLTNLWHLRSKVATLLKLFSYKLRLVLQLSTLGQKCNLFFLCVSAKTESYTIWLELCSISLILLPILTAIKNIIHRQCSFFQDSSQACWLLLED